MQHTLLLTTAFAFWLGAVTNLSGAIPEDYTGTPFAGEPLNGNPQEIPGTIKAVYFDDGGAEVAYHPPAGGACPFRTDGVSMQLFEAYKDLVSGADSAIGDSAEGTCHLAYIILGQWLKYTVHVTRAGTYNLELHESVVTPTSTLKVGFSGQEEQSILDMPMSEHVPGEHELYHNWKWDMTPNTYDLDTGLYVLKLEFVAGGWNFDAMRFSIDGEVAEASGHPETARAVGFNVMPVLTGMELSISYSLNETGPATVSVFDFAGKRLAQPVTRDLAAGRHTLTLGLENTAAGVHFIRVEQNGRSEVKAFTVFQ